MNEKKLNSVISEHISEEVSQQDAAAATISQLLEDGQTSSWSTYESFFWLFSYSKMFMTRLGKDIYRSILSYFYSERALPDHIMDLMTVQKNIHLERESHKVSCISSREHHRTHNLRLSMRKFFKAFKSYILSSEDDIGLQCTLNKDYTDFSTIDKEPMFVIVDSSCISEPSSKELLVDKKTFPRDNVLKKYFDKNILPADVPSTSKDKKNDHLPLLKESESRDELQMIDINLQSENNIPVDDNETENESVVISYLRNKDAFLDLEGTLLSTRKKSSLLDSVPKMETIPEGEQFAAFPILQKNEVPLSFLEPKNKNEKD